MGENISNIDYLDNIELLPVTMALSIRSKKEILDRLLVDYTIASIATYAFCSANNLINPFLKALDEKYDVSNLMDKMDKELLVNICCNRFEKNTIEELTYRFEGVNMCMWFLSLVDEITYENKCSVKKINDVLLTTPSYKDLLDKCVYRTIDELFNYYSVISKFTYSDTEIDPLVQRIINNQDISVRYMVLYNFNKNGLKVRYKKDNLKFEFELPSVAKFTKATKNSLFALKGINNLRVLAQELEESKIQDNVTRLESNGFEIVDVKYISSLYIERRIVKVTIEKGPLKINSYYVHLGPHLIRIDFNVGITNIESDIIYSLKIFE